ncbi:suppressor of cytokine signaling 2 [Denticeps clupeoides]|uniref:Suppressor of cytokine signaling 2 n=1 Tax=Denticeps clupeoides TaxID=299321 RepID=A0AAY4AVB7_9TELE|nr:suppressor of cytokine signaling 2-like [Denticeps clupeoides]
MFSWSERRDDLLVVFRWLYLKEQPLDRTTWCDSWKVPGNRAFVYRSCLLGIRLKSAHAEEEGHAARGPRGLDACPARTSGSGDEAPRLLDCRHVREVTGLNRFQLKSKAHFEAPDLGTPEWTSSYLIHDYVTGGRARARQRSLTHAAGRDRDGRTDGVEPAGPAGPLDARGRDPDSSPMTCQSSDSGESVEYDRRSETVSRAVDSEQTRIASAMRDLKNTGWYWGRISANEAKEILQDASEGTFLLRDSSQRDYLFTISAMTSAGPTNLRIEYKEGKFKLDSVLLVKPKLKQFESVVHLVEHYVHLSRTSCKGISPALGSSNGAVQLLLTTPVYMATPSLQHLCRIAINRSTRQVQDLPLPQRLKDYLTDYNYHV